MIGKCAMKPSTYNTINSTIDNRDQIWSQQAAVFYSLAFYK